MKCAWLALLAACSLLPAMQDGACTAGSSCCTPPSAAGVETVLCPVGQSSVQMIEQAPRLSTLVGKTIALVGGSFMAHVTHPELKRLIESEFPGVRVLMLSEIGSAGPWPGAGVASPRKDAFARALQEQGVQAVVAGNGGCGLCTPKEMGSCIVAEHMGIPSVMIAAPGFVTQAQKTALAAGIPVPRVAEYPGAFAGHTREQLIANTRRVLWPRIKAVLMEPVTADERARTAALQTQGIDAGESLTGSPDEINRAFRERGWSDGLPIVPPTEARVAEFLRFAAMPADAVVGTLPIAQRRVTVRHVAINGVMAGCPPEYMPILIAFTKALNNGYFRRTLSSTHAWNPYCWVNGPVARQLGIVYDQGAISAQANALIGRFMNLALRNLAGYYPGENRMGSFGYLMPWCMAEDERTAREIGWQPYHVQQGYGLNENTLTAASALAWGNNMAPATSDARQIMQLMAWDATEKQQFALGSGMPFVYRTFLITPPVARILALSYRSKERLEAALASEARVPLEQRTYANYYANPGSVVRATFAQHMAKIAAAEEAEETPAPAWLAWCSRKTLLTVPVMKLGKSAFLVTGDASRNKTMCVPGGAAATIRIDLPDDWDALLEPLGYAPLKSYYLPVDR